DRERTAGIESGAEARAERAAGEHGGAARAAVAAEHLDTVAGRGGGTGERGEEGGAPRKVLGIGVGGEHGAVGLVPRRDDVGDDLGSRRAEAPLGVRVGAEAAGAGAAIHERQHGELYRRVDGDERRELVREFAALVLPAGDARGVAPETTPLSSSRR